MKAVREALRQVWEGADFMPPGKLLENITPEKATVVPPGSPYSIATNVVHADIWNCVWLARLEGTGKVNPFPDFPKVAPSEWAGVRARFLANLERAYEIASADPVRHKMRSDDGAVKVLLEIAVHTSYHLGQIKLLMRMLRSGKPAKR